MRHFIVPIVVLPSTLLLAACSAAPPPPAGEPPAGSSKPVGSAAEVAKAEDLSKGTFVVEEDSVAWQAEDPSKSWKVPVHLYPASSPRAPGRVGAANAKGVFVTGASDGSLVGLDRHGKGLFQLGVRGAVSKIEARDDESFEVETTTGKAVIGPTGTVLSDTTADAAGSPRPTFGYRARRAASGGAPLGSVQSVLPTGPEEAWALTLMSGVYRFEKGEWRRQKVTPPRFSKEAFVTGQPAGVGALRESALELGPGGALLLVGARRVEEQNGTSLPAQLAPVLLALENGALRERREVSVAAAGIDPETYGRYPSGSNAETSYAVSPRGREVLCHRDFCVGQLEEPAAPSGSPKKAPPPKPWKRVRVGADDANTAHRRVAFAGETLWGYDGEALYRDGKPVEGEMPAVADVSEYSLFATGADDVWLVLGSRVGSTGAVVHWNGKTLENVGISGASTGWGSSPTDVWLAGQDGANHFDGKEWRRIVGVPGLGTGAFLRGSAAGADVWVGSYEQGLFQISADPKASPDLRGAPAKVVPSAAPGQPLVVGGVDTAYRLERVSFDLGGGKGKLESALGVAVGPGGVVWLEDGHRVVEVDGAKVRLLHETAPRRPLACLSCLAPASAGGGLLIGRDDGGRTELREIAAGAAAGRLVQIDDLAALGRGPSGWTVAVSAEEQNGLPRAIVHAGAGIRMLDGLPAAAYSSVAVRAEDEIWFAGGLSESRDDTHVWPAGEGTLVLFDGQGFTRFRAPEGALLSVASAGPKEVWAAGLGGGLVHVKAGRVEAFRIQLADGRTLSRALRSVAVGGPDDVWIAGDGSTLSHRDANGIRSVDASAAGKDGSLYAIVPPGAGPGWLVGPTGIFRIHKS